MHAQHYSRRKWHEEGKNEHNVEQTAYVYVQLITCYNKALSSAVPLHYIYFYFISNGLILICCVSNISFDMPIPKVKLPEHCRNITPNKMLK